MFGIRFWPVANVISEDGPTGEVALEGATRTSSAASASASRCHVPLDSRQTRVEWVQNSLPPNS